MDYLRSVFGKKQIKLAIISCISLCLAVVITFICVNVSGKIVGDNMAKRWSGDNKYAKESIFFGDLASFTESSARQLEYSVSKKLAEDSIVAENDGARAWVYTYSTVKKLSANSKSSSIQVKTYGVGNDFFLFHPMKLVEGSFFNGTETNDDLIVIDKDVAWMLYGSYDIVGQIVEIFGREFVIVGVVEREDGKLNNVAGNNEPTMYINFSAMSTMYQDLPISTYEAVIPNPISGYAGEAIKKGISEDEERYEIVENTKRYHFVNLLKHAKGYATRGMNAKAIKYPYWENYSRGMEDILTPICVITLLLYLLPTVLLIMLIVRMWMKRTIHKEDVKDFIERKIEKAREKRLKKRIQGGKIDEKNN